MARSATTGAGAVPGRSPCTGHLPPPQTSWRIRISPERHGLHRDGIRIRPVAQALGAAETAATFSSVLSIVTPLLDGLEAVHQSGSCTATSSPTTIYVRADGTPVLSISAPHRVGTDQDMTTSQSTASRPSSSTTAWQPGPLDRKLFGGAVIVLDDHGKKPVEWLARQGRPLCRHQTGGCRGLRLAHARSHRRGDAARRGPPAQAVPPFRARHQGAGAQAAASFDPQATDRAGGAVCADRTGAPTFRARARRNTSANVPSAHRGAATAVHIMFLDW